ncbi:hypothetical protein ACFLZP_03455, partial [Patescibacteria group bacterium]
ENRGQKTEIRKQKAENRRQTLKIEDRRRISKTKKKKTESRRQSLKNGKQKRALSILPEYISQPAGHKSDPLDHK